MYFLIICPIVKDNEATIADFYVEIICQLFVGSKSDDIAWHLSWNYVVSISALYYAFKVFETGITDSWWIVLNKQH